MLGNLFDSKSCDTCGESLSNLNSVLCGACLEDAYSDVEEMADCISEMMAEGKSREKLYKRLVVAGKDAVLGGMRVEQAMRHECRRPSE